MPTNAADTEIAYAGNGVTVAFAFPFEVAKASHFEATIDGAVVTTYTLSGLGVDTGGTCTFTTAPANAAAVVLARVAPYARTDFDYQEGGELAATTLDDDLDRAAMVSQQLATTLKRVPRVKRGDLTVGLDLVPEASTLLAWNAGATALVNVDAVTVSPTGVVMTSLGQSLVTAATPEDVQIIMQVPAEDLIARGLAGGRLSTRTNAAGSPYSHTPAQSSFVYYSSYSGTVLGLYDGGRWKLADIQGFVSGSYLSIGALTDNRPFDVFGYYNAGIVALEGGSWASDTVRATALSQQDTVWVKQGDPTRRYLGTCRKRAGFVNNLSPYLEVWNIHNQIPVTAFVTDTTDTWAIVATATWRQARAAAANQIEFVSGMDGGVIVTAHAYARATNSTATGRFIATGIGVNSAAVTSAPITIGATCPSTIGGRSTAHLPGHQTPPIAAGQNYLAWLERGDGTETQTFQGDNGIGAANGVGCGLVATILM
mgnify:CR=1 FL=1